MVNQSVPEPIKVSGNDTSCFTDTEICQRRNDWKDASKTSFYRPSIECNIVLCLINYSLKMLTHFF